MIDLKNDDDEHSTPLSEEEVETLEELSQGDDNDEEDLYSLGAMLGETVRVFLTNGSVVTGDFVYSWEDALTLTNTAVRTRDSLYSCETMLVYLSQIQAIGTQTSFKNIGVENV